MPSSIAFLQERTLKLN